MNKFAQAALLALTSWPLACSAAANPPDWRNNQLLVPEKVTVGPADNYQAKIDAQQEWLIFTRHQHLASQLVQQNLKTGRLRELLPPDQDAKDPALSPSGEQLALTSYRGNALGSVCLLPLQPEAAALQCLTPAGQRAWLPFWVDENTLGYLLQPRQGDAQELVLHHLQEDRREVLVRGQVSAPSVSTDGRWIVYQQRQGLYVFDLQTRSHQGPLLLDLPGRSSYSQYNPADGFLYFSHYLSDTNGDQQIDGEDHSVIFRLPLAEALAKTEPLLPEQLTSVAHNCNFPALGGDFIYLTCAYEGSLDTYRLPLSGQLPTHWEAEEIRQAYASASLEADRLLLLNSLRYRQGQTQKEQLEALLANHLQMNELTAALFYTHQLLAQAQTQARSAFYNNLSLLLQLQARQQLQPRGQLTPSYRRQLQEATERLQATGEKQLFLAWFESLENQPERARERLQRLNWPQLPLANYLQIQLALALASQPEERLKAHLQAANNPLIASEGRLYHGFHYLQGLNRQLRNAPQQQRLALQKALAGLEDRRLQDLFKNELDLLALGAAQERSDERTLYQTISNRLRAWSDEPVMHRASHLRALQLMGLAEKYDLMELMSRHWLTTTNIRHVSFADSAAQYARINLDRGYGTLAAGKDQVALNTFYSVLRQTSNLEALYNLLRLGLQETAEPAQRQRMQSLYEQLQAEQLLGNNTLYAEALKPLLTTPEPDLETLQASAAKLQQLEVTGLNTGVRDLLLGYLYHRQLLLTQDGYQGDPELAQSAHYHYMLGLDLAFNNPRVEVALLENLGQLHFQLGNSGLAADFFAQRLLLPWLSQEQRVWVLWQQARALYYSNREQQAAEQAQQALNLAQQLQLDQLPALREKTAFYRLQAKQYEQANTLYTQLLEAEQLPAGNALKAHFARGYALFQLQQQEASQKAFLEVLQALPAAEPRAARPERLAGFQPERLEVQSYGFLAQLAATPEEALGWLDKRLQLLHQMHSKDRRFHWDETSRYRLIVQARLQKAALEEQLQQPEAVANSMDTALQELQTYYQAGGSRASQPSLQTLYNYLTLGASYPQAFMQKSAVLEKQIEAALDELKLGDYTPPVNQYQHLKLRLLRSFYAWQMTTQDLEALLQPLRELRAQPTWQTLANTRPDLLAELEALAEGIVQQASAVAN